MYCNVFLGKKHIAVHHDRLLVPGTSLSKNSKKGTRHGFCDTKNSFLLFAVSAFLF